MTKPFLPKTMRAWQYSTTKGGLEKNLHLNTIPVPTPKPNQHLIQVLATALNPVDYKLAEIPYIGAVIRPRLATPGIDFAGRIVMPAEGSKYKVGDMVFGVCGTSPIAGGMLKKFSLVEEAYFSGIPEDVRPLDACGVGVAGITALQSIAPHVKEGDHIFINGGSGGTGVFGIQIAKAVGCHVTTSCSTPNVELCKSLGADEVIDYRKGGLLEELKKSGVKFDHAVDNAGKDKELIWRCDEFMKPKALYVLVAGEPSLSEIADSMKRKLIPGALGGVKGNVVGFWPSPSTKDLTRIVEWMRDGKLKAVVDSKFAFEDAPKAFEKLKTGHARGKVVVNVALETYKKASAE